MHEHQTTARHDGRAWTVTPRGVVRRGPSLRAALAGYVRDVRNHYIDAPLRGGWLLLERSFSDRVVADIQRRLDVHHADSLSLLVKAMQSSTTVTLRVTTAHEDGSPVQELTFPADAVPRSGDILRIGRRRYTCMGLDYQGYGTEWRPYEIQLWPIAEPTDPAAVPMPDPEGDRREPTETCHPTREG